MWVCKYNHAEVRNGEIFQPQHQLKDFTAWIFKHLPLNSSLVLFMASLSAIK